MKWQTDGRTEWLTERVQTVDMPTDGLTDYKCHQWHHLFQKSRFTLFFGQSISHAGNSFCTGIAPVFRWCSERRFNEAGGRFSQWLVGRLRLNSAEHSKSIM
eukprot:Selendium_serpulae@DN4246_c0_g1_i2.p2